MRVIKVKLRSVAAKECGQRMSFNYGVEADLPLWLAPREALNGANGMSDIEGKAVGGAASERGRRASFSR